MTGNNTPRKPEPGGEPDFMQDAVDVSGIDISSEQLRQLVDREYGHARMLSRIGLIIVVLGVAVLLLRVSGLVDWTIKVPGLSSTLSNASPGIILVVAGTIIILINRPSVKVSGRPPKR